MIVITCYEGTLNVTTEGCSPRCHSCTIKRGWRTYTRNYLDRCDIDATGWCVSPFLQVVSTCFNFIQTLFICVLICQRRGRIGCVRNIMLEFQKHCIRALESKYRKFFQPGDVNPINPLRCAWGSTLWALPLWPSLSGTWKRYEMTIIGLTRWRSGGISASPHSIRRQTWCIVIEGSLEV